MGLLPLEFTDCLQDSPYFRDSLHSHEKELERTSNNIKELIKEVKNLLQAAKNLSNAQRRLSNTLINFKFECIGNNQTDDELVIANSLKEFGKLIAAIEDEKDRMLDRAYEQFIAPLENFRKEHIGAVKEGKKKFEKQTAKFCASQERYLGLSTKKQDTVLQEADAILEMERRDFIRAGLEYVCLIQEVQERKKFEFVETLLGFMYSWLTFYHHGHEVAKDFKPHMTELQSRIQNTREHFNSSREDIKALMRKMLEVRQSKSVDPGTLNKMFTRSGYLFMMEKKALGTTWNKYYCHYQREGRIFCSIPYNQSTGKIVSNDNFRLRTCTRRVSDSIDKRFCFDITPEDKPGTTYTFQALSEEDLELWLDAMDGKEPMYFHPPKPSNAHQTFLDESGFNFITRCFKVLENRGLDDQGLYRVVGVSSKVTKLLTMGLDKRKSDKMNLDDPMEWESKTITSAAKTFLRNLPEPLMTFKMHSSFIAAAKLDSYQQRVSEVQRLVEQLPEPHKRMLEVLCTHLEKVANNAERNMMTVGNLGVCFGPTLLRSEEETVAAIMDIKFANVVVEILIENWRQILLGEPPSPSRRISLGGSGAAGSATSAQQLTVLPLSPGQFSIHHSASTGSIMTTPPKSFSTSPRMVSPPQRPPPPYPHPPPPPHGSTSSVIYKNGPKSMHSSNWSSSGAHMSPGAGGNTPYHSATWERTLRMSSSNLVVPPPMGSAPSSTMSPQHQHNVQHPQHKPVRASLSNLSAPVTLSDHVSSPAPGKGASNNNAPLQQQPGIVEDQQWYRQNKISTAKTLQLQRQLSSGSSSIQTGPTTPNKSPGEFHRVSSSGNVAAAQHQQQQQQYSEGPPMYTYPPPHLEGVALRNTSSSPKLPRPARVHSGSSIPQQQQQQQQQQPASYYRGDGSGNQSQGNSSSSSMESLTSESSKDASAKEPYPTGIQQPQEMESAAMVAASTAAAAVASSSAVAAAAAAAFGSPQQPQQQLDPKGTLSSSSSSSSSSSVTRKLRSEADRLPRVRTLYACVGEHDTELSFEPNQVITSVRPSLEPGWLEGCLDGKMGLVPENYVEYIT